MSTTAEPPVVAADPAPPAPLRRARGLELLGEVSGSGYKDGAALVRRGDGQMVQLGPLLYATLHAIDGERDVAGIAGAMSEYLGRGVEPEHVVALAEKLAGQGLLSGTEENAPPRSNPLLALRWKVLVTDPAWTRRLTSPLLFLFRPRIMLPVLAAFVGVAWFVLIHKGVASATAQAFNSPFLLLLVFALAIASAAFHELGHASACRYGGATPAGMGAGIYLVWPAFYTDVTDAYRLPRRDRLRVDLGGLYFNAVIAVVTLAVWLAVHVDALLLLIALQMLEMVKQMSPMIRSDGYHIFADATGVPDLFAHIGPTLRRLLPGHRAEPSALTGRARLGVTLWVLIVVPILLSLSISALLLFPRLAATAWASAHHITATIPGDLQHGRIIDLAAALLRLVALVLPVLGVSLMAQRLIRSVAGRLRSWSTGSPVRQGVAIAGSAVVVAAAIWAWWPADQYRPVRASDRGTLFSLASAVAAPGSVARPAPTVSMVRLSPGTHLAVALIPHDGVTKAHPAIYVVKGTHGDPGAVLVSSATPAPAKTSGPAAGAASAPTTAGATTTTPTSAPAPSAPAASSSSTVPAPVAATAFPFALPSKPGPGGTQALAVNTSDGKVTYDVAYSLVTVRDGAPVTNTNSAFALASCRACTTVAVSFQIVLIVGQTKSIVPINVAGALNVNCPACITTAIADQIVVTLKSEPSDTLLTELQADLEQLDALPALGATGTPDAVASEVAAVQSQIEAALGDSGQLSNPPPTTTTAGPAPGQTTTTTQATTTTPTTTTSPAAASTTPTTSTTSTTSTTPAAPPSTSTTSTTSTTTTTPPDSSTTDTTTTSAPTAGSGTTTTTP